MWGSEGGRWGWMLSVKGPSPEPKTGCGPQDRDRGKSKAKGSCKKEHKEPKLLLCILNERAKMSWQNKQLGIGQWNHHQIS